MKTTSKENLSLIRENRKTNMDLISEIRVGDFLISDEDFASEYKPTKALNLENLLVTEDSDY